MGVIAAVLWFVLPVTFGCVAAMHGLSFWLGFLLGALANGVLRFQCFPKSGGNGNRRSRRFEGWPKAYSKVTKNAAL